MFSDFLLTVDFDRTLTAPDASIPARNLEAIRFFMARGGAFTVNTGRSLAMFRHCAALVPVNAPLLLFNGSAAYDQQKQEFSALRPISLDREVLVRELMELLPDMVVEVQGLDRHYIFREDPMWLAFNEANGCRAAYASVDQDLGPFLKMCIYGAFRAPSVAHLFQGSRDDIGRFDQAEALLRRRYGDKLEIFRSGARILDIHAKGVSKAKSARALQHRLGRKYLVCVGDEKNDTAMLREADYAFCPADGVIAPDFPNVCPCGEGAVADVIYRKIPEILENRT